MAGTRSSARQAAAAAQSSSPSSSQSKPAGDRAASGSKRKGGPTASPKPKRGRKGDKKEQLTIEETMPKKDKEEDKDVEMKDEDAPKDEADAQIAREGSQDGGTKTCDGNQGSDEPEHERTKGKDDTAQNGENLTEQGSKMDDTDNLGTTGEAGNDSKAANGDNAVQESSKRAESTPFSILEKGIIYFFERGRVGIDEPSKPDEIARSYIIMRPMPRRLSFCSIFSPLPSSSGT